MSGRHPVESHDHPDLVTVACANFTPVPDDRAATLAKVTATVRDAVRQGAQLIAFPEQTFGVVGYCAACDATRGSCPEHHHVAEPVPGPTTQALAELAAELGVYITVGIDELDPDDPEVVYNAAALVGPEGILGTYRKLHLGHPLETCRYTPGTSLPVWSTALGPIGILICYDFWSNPELSRLLALKGARLLVNVTRSNAGSGKARYIQDTTVVRAQENLVYAMSANWAGPAPDGVGGGHSTIAGPAFPAFNRVLGAAGEHEELVVATLNFRQLGRWYDLFPWSGWRLDPDRQLPVTRLVADEFAALAEGGRPDPPAPSAARSAP